MKKLIITLSLLVALACLYMVMDIREAAAQGVDLYKLGQCIDKNCSKGMIWTQSQRTEFEKCRSACEAQLKQEEGMAQRPAEQAQGPLPGQSQGAVGRKVPMRSPNEVLQRQQLLGRYAREAADISEMLSGQGKESAFHELIQRFNAEDFLPEMKTLFSQYVDLQDKLLTGVPRQLYPKMKRYQAETYSHLLDGCRY